MTDITIKTFRAERGFYELPNGIRLYDEDWNGEVYDGSTSDDGIHFHNNGTQFRPVYGGEFGDECRELIGFEEV